MPLGLLKRVAETGDGDQLKEENVGQRAFLAEEVETEVSHMGENVA